MGLARSMNLLYSSVFEHYNFLQFDNYVIIVIILNQLNLENPIMNLENCVLVKVNILV